MYPLVQLKLKREPTASNLNGMTTLETFGNFVKKLKIHFIAIILLHIYLIDIKT